VLAVAVVLFVRHDWPVHLIPSLRAFLRAACQIIGIGFDENEIAPVLAKLGPVARVVGATLSNTANPTALTAGYKANVVPQTASALIDGRFLPGYEDEFLAELDTLLGPGVRREFVKRSIAVQTTFDGALCDAMTAAVLRVDPEANVVPYCLSGGTDGKWFSQIGVRCFGFAPLRLPPELDFTALFHGVDERVPVAALEFGTEVLDHFIDMC
jgi:acetylornithine deacetylase/succinyl-diaminopimelate desuccinylase-like protein